jgi:hypothetical protein
VKLLQKRIENILEHTVIGNNFLNRKISQHLRERIDKWDHTKLKNFCTSKETVITMTRQLTEWKKIFASYASDKGLITRIYKELKKSTLQRINNLSSKWPNELK